jgi:hypothetical protein
MQQSFKLLGISHAALVHQSSKKSHTNADIKRSRILVPSGKRNSPDEVRISASLADYNPQPKKKPKKNISTAISTEDKAKQFLQQFPPSNGTHCDLRELVVGLLENSASPIFGCSVRKVHNHLQEQGKLVCSHMTLHRRCLTYTNDAVLPRAGDDGAVMGRRPLIAVIAKILLCCVGVTDGMTDMISD